MRLIRSEVEHPLLDVFLWCLSARQCVSYCLAMPDFYALYAKEPARMAKPAKGRTRPMERAWGRGRSDWDWLLCAAHLVPLYTN